MVNSVIVSLFLCVFTSVKLPQVCFIALCGNGSGCGSQHTAVTPFPPDSVPVPCTASVVQPLSDVCCAHTDTGTQSMNADIGQTQLYMYTFVCA